MSEPTLLIGENGNKYWTNSKGEYHRIDGPAVERFNGTKEWYKDGKRHRIDGPAIEWSCGTKEWYQNDLSHRVDGPAIEFSTGNFVWYYKDKHFGDGIDGFWAFWDHLNDEERQNIDLHIWLKKLTKD